MHRQGHSDRAVLLSTSSDGVQYQASRALGMNMGCHAVGRSAWIWGVMQKGLYLVCYGSKARNLSILRRPLSHWGLHAKTLSQPSS